MKNITGRDGYVIAKALAYAIEAIAALPEERQELGDQDDMKAILEAMYPGDGQLAHLIQGARAHLTGEGFYL